MGVRVDAEVRSEDVYQQHLEDVEQQKYRQLLVIFNSYPTSLPYRSPMNTSHPAQEQTKTADA